MANPATATVEPAKQDHINPSALGHDFGLEEFKARTWRYKLSEAQTIANALDPTFWRHQADQIMGQDKSKGHGDIIRLFKPDTSEFAELLVVELGKGYIKTRLIREAKPDEVAIPVDSPLSTKWNVGRRAHDVVRKADGVVMAGGFQSKQSALDWINNHVKAMAA